MNKLVPRYFRRESRLGLRINVYYRVFPDGDIEYRDVVGDWNVSKIYKSIDDLLKDEAIEIEYKNLPLT